MVTSFSGETASEKKEEEEEEEEEEEKGNERLTRMFMKFPIIIKIPLCIINVKKKKRETFRISVRLSFYPHITIM